MKGIFYNSTAAVCSIWESGMMTYNALKRSNLYKLEYTEDTNIKDGYDFAIFNYNHHVNSWITPNKLSESKGINFCLVLEVGLKEDPLVAVPSYFPYYIILDPTIKDTANYFGFPRPLEESASDPYIEPKYPVIGSYGFPTYGKEWHKIVEQAQKEFDHALIRFNIPSATYIPNHNDLVREIEKQCRSVIHKPGINLEITQSIMTKDQLIQWCAQNTINCFFYNREHVYATGLAAVTDQAISARRPLLVSNDSTFRHIHIYMPHYPSLSIKQAIDTTQPLVEKIADDWSPEKFCLRFESILEKVLKKSHVAIINHAVANCGVYQYAKRLSNILIGSKGPITFTYHEISTLQEYQMLCSQHIDAIIYNYHSSTLPWLSNSTIQKKVPNVAIFHEGETLVTFDHLINIDASSHYTSIPRPLLKSNYSEYIPNIDEPVIGSFGFGFYNKGFVRLIEYVNAEFDKATIRLNITFAHFGDQNGLMGRNIAQTCMSVPRKEGIKLEITHNFMTDVELLDFLNENTINIFLYDKTHQRGCSSVIDYALSVNRPIGISDSEMFRHIYSDQICVYKTPIRNIITNGLSHLNKFKEDWSSENLLRKIDIYISKILSRDKPQTIKMKNNTVLNDDYRALLASDISELFRLAPAMMSRKIMRANVQQAFVFKYIRNNFTTGHSMICAGSHEDTCCAALKALNYNIVEVDPMYNSDLHTYCVSHSYPQYDVVFSVSVIQQVQNDNDFVDDMCKLLKPDGTCVLTCDFNDSYKPGCMIIPSCDFRFYTKEDLLERFGKILEKNDCYIEGEIDYSAPPDFLYEGRFLYTFGTLIFKKKTQ